MNSLITRTATRFLITLLILFALFLLARGHNEPGGGFIAGLVAASAVALYAVSYDSASARRLIRIDPRWYIVLGLAVALASGLIAIAAGAPFMTGYWVEVNAGLPAALKLGTPLLFDLGVFMVVVGVVVTMVLWIAEE